MTWVMVIFNTATDEVEVVDVGEDETRARQFFKAYADNIAAEEARIGMSLGIRLALTKPRPMVMFVPHV